MSELGYWKIKCLGQSIRCLLTYVGEEFKDTHYEQGEAPEYSKEAWYSVKPKFEEIFDFPNLPYYIDGDIKITQSNAILRHIARKYKLDGDTEKEKAEIDMVLDQAMDLREANMELCYDLDHASFERRKIEYIQWIKPQLELLEKKLGRNDWFVGNKVTVADFPLFELLDEHLVMVTDILDDFPNLRGFLARFRNLPRVKEYLQLEKVKSLPINNKFAAFK